MGRVIEDEALSAALSAVCSLSSSRARGGSPWWSRWGRHGHWWPGRPPGCCVCQSLRASLDFIRCRLDGEGHKERAARTPHGAAGSRSLSSWSWWQVCLVAVWEGITGYHKYEKAAAAAVSMARRRARWVVGRGGKHRVSERRRALALFYSLLPSLSSLPHARAEERSPSLPPDRQRCALRSETPGPMRCRHFELWLPRWVDHRAGCWAAGSGRLLWGGMWGELQSTPLRHRLNHAGLPTRGRAGLARDGHFSHGWGRRWPALLATDRALWIPRFLLSVVLACGVAARVVYAIEMPKDETIFLIQRGNGHCGH